jgi:phospholipid/cholesterol/gamma-HCH transport system ATP-binding protein
MIRFEDVTTERGRSMSFDILPGESCKLITNSESGEQLLLQTIIGLKKPLEGKVFIFGLDIYSLSESEQLKLFRRIGIAWKGGGLISNLKVWENAILPACYHRPDEFDAIETRAADLFRRLGIEVSTGYMGRLPGPLSASEKCLIGVVRAMLMEPELMIYDSIFEGLYPETAERLAILTAWFHSERRGRTSVYISSHEQSLTSIPADKVLRPHAKR